MIGALANLIRTAREALAYVIEPKPHWRDLFLKQQVKDEVAEQRRRRRIR